MRIPAWLPMLLGALAAVGPLSTDMYLPAFPAIEASLGTPPDSAQITLAAWFAGLAVGQITQGTLADRYGRRLPLIVGTLTYAAANAGCALAPNIVLLSMLRVVAGFFGSASMVIPRAIVRDLADGHVAARLMSRLMLVMGVAPILAPSLGGAVLGVLTWHYIFWITTLHGAICALVVWRILPETLPETRRMRLGFGNLVARFGAVMRDRVFLAFAFTGGFGMFGMFAYIGGSPGVFIERYHLSPGHYAVLFSMSAGSFILASQFNPSVLRRFGVARLLRFGTRIYLIAAFVMLADAITGIGGVAGIVAPMMLATASMGFVMPNSAVGAMSRHGAQAGSASALMGTMQFCLAAVSGSLVGVLANGTAVPMASLVFAGAIAAVLCDVLRPKPVPVRA